MILILNNADKYADVYQVKWNFQNAGLGQLISKRGEK
jgi:hypothetical protein